jgi:tetratricopeptide (TPR) repeat protein
MTSGSDLTAALQRIQTFGELLRYLRRRARLTQRELGVAVGYNYSHISRLENDRRAPDPSSLDALFVPALRLSPLDDHVVAARLKELGARARGRTSSVAEPARATDRARPPAAGSAPHGVVRIPRQLPPTVRHFVGRRAEWDTLLRLVDHWVGPHGTGAITTIDGTAGIGKTTLAVHWARHAAARFPDGQLYANLRGFDPVGGPVDPADALHGFLEALGVAPEGMPARLQDRCNLFRSLVADRRILVVLDNAHGAEQARPLLPGAPGCFVLVTSRHRLTGLIAGEDAHPLTLDLLNPDEAHELLAARLGPDRLAAEPEAARELIALCARLPLALSVAAAGAAAPAHSLSTLTAELRDIWYGLDAAPVGDRTMDVRAVFSWSYRSVSPDAARMFRLLGLHPGRDFGVAAGASMVGVGVDTARRLLDELQLVHLLEQTVYHRYTMHDLLHAYAVELVGLQETQADRTDAVHRVLDYYLHTAYQANQVVNPFRDRIELPATVAGAVVETFAERVHADAWFTAELPALVAAIENTTGFDRYVWQLAWTLVDFVRWQGHGDIWLRTQRAAVEAAERLGDVPVMARTHRWLGVVCSALGLYDEALDHYNNALRRYGEVGDELGRAGALRALASQRLWTGRYSEALALVEHALAVYRAAGRQYDEAIALNMIGYAYAKLGRYRDTLTYCQPAYTILERCGDANGLAGTADSLGYAHYHLRHYRVALRWLRRSLEHNKLIGDRNRNLAETYSHLADTHAALREFPAARDAWQQALDLLDGLGHPDAELVRANLAQAQASA